MRRGMLRIRSAVGRSLFLKFIASFAPLFVLLSLAGLFALAEIEAAMLHNSLSARVGSKAAKVTAALERHEVAANSEIVEILLDTLLSDQAIECAEVKESKNGGALHKAPRVIGCLGQGHHQIIAIPFGSDDAMSLVLRVSTAEVEQATKWRRELSLMVLLCGLLVAVAASWWGFRAHVSIPLQRLLSSINTAPESGTKAEVPVKGSDEIAVITDGYNKLQSRIAFFNERLEERVAERTFAAELAATESRNATARLEVEVQERSRAEQQVQEQRDRLMRQQDALNELTNQSRLTGADWVGALRLLNEACAKALGVERVSFWEFGREPDRIYSVDLFEASAARHTSGVVLRAADFPRYFEAIGHLKIIAADNAHSDPRMSEFSASYLTPQNIGSMLDVPLVRNGELAGVLCVEHVGASRAWTPEQQVFASAISNLAALVLETRERRRIEDNLRASNDALQVATKTKSEFLATMSHEIRTPMNGVLGMLELLENTRLDATQRDLASTARDCGNGLLTILNDILDFSKIEAGCVGLEELSFQFDQLVRQVVALFEPKAREKKLSLDVAIAPDLPGWLIGDPTRLRQVLFNLVGNAVKFTERGGVSVKVGQRLLENGDIRLRVEVVDTGIGISREGVSKLFTHFTQADGSMTRRFGGTGLGLAICKQLVGLMGGQIGVESEPGWGSNFWFEVTTREGEAQAREPIAAEMVPERSVRPLQILVAEDNPVNQEILKALLETKGHEVRIANDGIEALRLVQVQRFDLVLMDIQMPGMDGTTVTRKIRGMGGLFSDIPIIALTANAMATQRDAYLAAGMNQFLGKPYRSSELFTAIAEVMGETVLPDAHRPVPGEAQAKAAICKPSSTVTKKVASSGRRARPLPLIDKQDWLEWQEGLDVDAIAGILSSVPAEGGACLKEIKAALGKGDLETARRWAHRLKGMAANLGAARLAATARRIEQGTDAPLTVHDQVNELEKVFKATVVALRGAGSNAEPAGQRGQVGLARSAKVAI